MRRKEVWVIVLVRCSWYSGVRVRASIKFKVRVVVTVILRRWVGGMVGGWGLVI